MTATKTTESTVVEGTVYGLFPESSRVLYEECIADLAEGRNIELSSTLDSKVTDIAEQVWKKIHRAEVVIADITGYDLQVMCQIGMARATKDSKKILLLCSHQAHSQQKARFPLDLEGLRLQPYDEDNFDKIRQDLPTLLNESLRNRAPAHPIDDLAVRQLVQKAIGHITNKDFLSASSMLKDAESRLPENWYIHMQQGVMCREQGDYPKAREYFKNAEKFVEFDEHRAEIYIDQAILEFRDNESSKAEALFERAKSTDKKNRRLYLAWAEVLDQLGMPETAVGRISDLMQALGRDEETTLLTQYYSTKLSNRHFTMNLKDFIKQRRNTKSQPVRVSSGHGESDSTAPTRKLPARPTNRVNNKAKKIPNNISWKDFEANYRGAFVEGIVKNVHSSIGVFVYLGDFKGLIPHRFAPKGLTDGDRLEVEILKTYLRDDGKEGIHLRFISKLS